MRTIHLCAVVCTAVGFFLLAGCSSRVCEPGAFADCDCPPGYIKGVKTCDTRGKAWGECRCVQPPERWPADTIPTAEEIDRLRRELEGENSNKQAPTPAAPHE